MSTGTVACWRCASLAVASATGVKLRQASSQSGGVLRKLGRRVLASECRASAAEANERQSCCVDWWVARRPGSHQKQGDAPESAQAGGMQVVLDLGVKVRRTVPVQQSKRTKQLLRSLGGDSRAMVGTTARLSAGWRSGSAWPVGERPSAERSHPCVQWA